MQFMKKVLTIIGFVLLAFVLCCRWGTPVADFYAVHIYPAISGGMSLVASIFPFSLEEITVVCFVAALITVIVKTIKKRAGFFSWLKGTALIVMWLFVWFYMGWGNNYFRTSLSGRLHLEKVHFDKDNFCRFLDDFTLQLNLAAEEAAGYDKDEIEDHIKEFYDVKAVACGYTGIRNWQHAKKPLLNPLYSAVGVMGYMGPFFCETQLNEDLQDIEYPFVMAHEKAHLAGVTSEAEANYWGFAFCRQSNNPAIRYSGYQGLLPYVFSHANSFLTEEEYKAWVATLSPRAKADYATSREYWQKKRVKWINSIQHTAMDLMLRTNKVDEGAKDYYGVISILMSMDAHEDKIITTNSK